MSKKRSSLFEKKINRKKSRKVSQEKNRGVTPSVAAPGVTHPSDATACKARRPINYRPYSTKLAARTSNTSIGRLQVGGEVALAGVNVDEVANSDVAGLAPGAVRVEVGDDVGRTADIVVAADAAAKPHPAVDRTQHQYHAAPLTARRERLVHAEVTSI